MPVMSSEHDGIVAGSDLTGSPSEAVGGSTFESLRQVLALVSRVPRAWLWAMVAAAVLSSVDASRSSRGEISLHLEFGTAALVALALIWLPVLLRLLLLTGGTLKAAGLEASATGLITRETLFNLLAQAKGVISAKEDDPSRVEAVKELDHLVEQIASEYLETSDSLDDDALASLARRYERLRRDTPPGPQRTSAMTRIVNEARVRGATSPSVGGRKALPLLSSPSQGDRIVGLALMQEAGNPAASDQVLAIVQDSATAFEMFHALLALQEMAFRMSSAQRAHAVEVLVAEREDPRGVGIGQDPGLPALIERTIGELKHWVG